MIMATTIATTNMTLNSEQARGVRMATFEHGVEVLSQVGPGTGRNHYRAQYR